MRQYKHGNRQKWVLTNVKRHFEVHARKESKTVGGLNSDGKLRKIDQFFKKNSNIPTETVPLSSLPFLEEAEKETVASKHSRGDPLFLESLEINDE